MSVRVAVLQWQPWLNCRCKCYASCSGCLQAHRLLAAGFNFQDAEACGLCVQSSNVFCCRVQGDHQNLAGLVALCLGQCMVATDTEVSNLWSLPWIMELCISVAISSCLYISICMRCRRSDSLIAFKSACQLHESRQSLIDFRVGGLGFQGQATSVAFDERI